ncbi:hypothetical protein [Pseudoramibacter sp.]|uniref:hypothetical protein n=1 Tax=Pseudoramibacter sp. TaxID=2034862 RepID=UPI0025F3E168|nr:hypothetical protein [Pseudoramibacter sp.]MCH4071835.1 hypothetical protein [Pseudoramibacter sp.]MCH4105604.1 hypothetical protein [Pseudoramibacter sp.]
MVKAELRYNPYTLKTAIRFNGRAPRVNSLVEKYIGGRLEDWIDKVPEIFAGEMNGYGFELDFSGTAQDFDELKGAFRRASVGEGEVSLFLKNELEPRQQKLDEINGLLAWLERRRNRQLDLKGFKERHPEIFEKTLNLVCVGGPFFEAQDVHGMTVAADHVEKAAELKETRIRNTPIVLWTDRDHLAAFQRNLSELLSRSDVTQKQLFFQFADDVDTDKARRIAEDLGVRTPQIVTSVRDGKLQQYMALYPVTDYIHQVLAAFRAFAQKAQPKLEGEQQKGQSANQALHRKIDGVIRELVIFKQCLERFKNRDNLAVPGAWEADKDRLLAQIENWQRRKTKISGETDGTKMAEALNVLVQKQYQRYIEQFSADTLSAVKKVEQALAALYAPAAAVSPFKPRGTAWENLKAPAVPDLKAPLLAIREERTVMEKGFFDTAAHPVRHVDFQVQKWRQYAAEQVRPIAEALQRRTFAKLQQYYGDLAAAYTAHLQQCIQEKDDASSALSAQMSDEDRRLQEDADWFGELSDQLESVARN